MKRAIPGILLLLAGCARAPLAPGLGTTPAIATPVAAAPSQAPSAPATPVQSSAARVVDTPALPLGARPPEMRIEGGKSVYYHTTQEGVITPVYPNP